MVGLGREWGLKVYAPHALEADPEGERCFVGSNRIAAKAAWHISPSGWNPQDRLQKATETVIAASPHVLGAPLLMCPDRGRILRTRRRRAVTSSYVKSQVRTSSRNPHCGCEASGCSRDEDSNRYSQKSDSCSPWITDNVFPCQRTR